jgi:hypothetical protein
MKTERESAIELAKEFEANYIPGIGNSPREKLLYKFARALLAEVAENERLREEAEESARCSGTELKELTAAHARVQKLERDIGIWEASREEANAIFSKQLARIEELEERLGPAGAKMLYDIKAKCEQLEATEAKLRSQLEYCSYERIQSLEATVAGMRGANTAVGAWLSAALEDPGVCAEMKADISKWFETFDPSAVTDYSRRVQGLVDALKAQCRGQRMGEGCEMISIRLYKYNALHEDTILPTYSVKVFIQGKERYVKETKSRRYADECMHTLEALYLALGVPVAVDA